MERIGGYFFVAQVEGTKGDVLCRLLCGRVQWKQNRFLQFFFGNPTKRTTTTTTTTKIHQEIYIQNVGFWFQRTFFPPWFWLEEDVEAEADGDPEPNGSRGDAEAEAGSEAEDGFRNAGELRNGARSGDVFLLVNWCEWLFFFSNHL